LQATIDRAADLRKLLRVVERLAQYQRDGEVSLER
jgi:hypothetical protein